MVLFLILGIICLWLCGYTAALDNSVWIGFMILGSLFLSIDYSHDKGKE